MCISQKSEGLFKIVESNALEQLEKQMSRLKSMAVKVPVVPNIGAGAYAQTATLASKNIGRLSGIGSRVVVPDWKIPIKANETFKRDLNKYPSGLVNNSVSSKMVSSFDVLSKNARQLSTLYGCTC